MDEEEDDFYGGPVKQEFDHDVTNHEQDDNMDVTAEQEEEEEEDDSDDDVQFTLEKPEGSRPESSTQSRTAKQQSTPNDRSVSVDIKPAPSTTPVKQEPRTGSTQPTAVKGTLNYDGREGKDFPEVRTSKVDVNSIPTWINGKTITELDIDADLAEHSKPWRLPGTDQTDFFNYGFDEYTWAQYCLRQSTMAGSIAEQKQADANMKAMFGGGGAPGGAAGMPPGMLPMPGMPGMPSPEEMMEQMMSQGLNPSDPNAFMQMMMGGGPMQGGGQGQQNQQQGGFGGGFGGQNNASPHPQGGQGFQPPKGPAAQTQGDQGGFGVNMEGFSPQQIAIMQQQQGGMQGGGRRGGRGGRGRWH